MDKFNQNQNQNQIDEDDNLIKPKNLSQVRKYDPAKLDAMRQKSWATRRRNTVVKKRLTEAAQNILYTDLPYITLPEFYEKIKGLEIDGKEIKNVNLFVALFISVLISGIKRGDLDVLQFVYKLVSDIEEKEQGNKSLEFDKLIVAIQGIRG